MLLIKVEDGRQRKVVLQIKNAVELDLRVHRLIRKLLPRMKRKLKLVPVVVRRIEVLTTQVALKSLIQVVEVGVLQRAPQLQQLKRRKLNQSLILVMI